MSAQSSAAVSTDGTGVHVAFAGVHPDVDADRLQTLGEPFDLAVEGEPLAPYVLLASGAPAPVDLGPPLGQMLTVVDPASFVQLDAGLVDFTGAFTVPLALPAQSLFLGTAPVVQLVQVQAGPGLQLRFSNALFLHGQP